MQVSLKLSVSLIRRNPICEVFLIFFLEITLYILWLKRLLLLLIYRLRLSWLKRNILALLLFIDYLVTRLLLRKLSLIPLISSILINWLSLKNIPIFFTVKSRIILVLRLYLSCWVTDWLSVFIKYFYARLSRL